MIKRSILIGFLILAILPFENNKAYTQGIDPESIVATVNGKPILYKSVKLKKNIADIIFENKYSHPPQNEDDHKKVKQIQRDSEVEGLAQAIRNAIHDEVQLKNHITVSSQELKDKWEETFQPEDFEKKLRKARKAYAPVFLAAEAVLENKMSAEKAYQKYLNDHKNIRNMKDWKRFLKQFKTPEHLASYKKILGMTAKEQAEISYPSMEGWVIQDKLNHIIDKELAATDPEVAELHSIQKKIKRFKKKYKKLKSSVAFGTDLMNQKRNKWWRARYREADIKIKAPEFNSALKSVLGGLDKR